MSTDAAPYDGGLPVVYADFNARTAQDHVRLSTRGSRASLGVAPGVDVWLTDGEVIVKARVERVADEVVGVVDWDTLLECP